MPHGEPNEDGFTWGGSDSATWGQPDPGTWGPQRERRYAVRLRRGTRSTIIDAVQSIDLQLVHSAVSSLQCTVPRSTNLANFKLGTLELLYGDNRLFRGRLTEYPGPGTSETGTIGGPGPAHRLKRTDLSVSFSGVAAHEAIAETWRQDTPFTATVLEPNSTTTLSDFSAEGTALEVIQELHTQAGMNFTVQFQNDTLTVESYVPEENPRTQAWDAVSYESSGDVSGYANKVVVYGGTAASGQRVTASAKDQTEIDALAANGVGDDGVVEARVDDRNLVTDSDAKARADAELQDRLENDSLSGSLEIMPQIVLPGYYYDIPEFETDGTVPKLPINEVGITEAGGEAGVTLDVNTPGGPIALLARLERGQAQLNQPAPTASGSDDTTDPVTVIDSFEDQDFSEYRNQVDEWTTVGDGALSWPVPDGSYVAKNAAGQGFSRIISTSGLGEYFPKGNEAKIATRATAVDGKLRVLFGLEDKNRYYTAVVDYDNSELRIGRLNGAGTRTTLASGAISPSADTTGTVTITWDDGSLGGSDNDITVAYSEGGTQQNSISTNDSTHADNDGIGIVGDDNDTADLFVDYYRLV